MTGTHSTHSASHISKSPTVFHFESCHLMSMFTFLNSRESSPYPLLFLMTFHPISLSHTHVHYIHTFFSLLPHTLSSLQLSVRLSEKSNNSMGAATCAAEHKYVCVCVCMCMYIKRVREREKNEKKLNLNGN